METFQVSEIISQIQFNFKNYLIEKKINPRKLNDLPKVSCLIRVISIQTSLF